MSRIWLVAATAALAFGLVAVGPIAQWSHYHAFADSRAWGAVPNAENVLSNLAFLAVGAWALAAMRRSPPRGPGRTAWWTFAAAVAATAFGSAVYHWAPSNAPLVFDRLPIAVACGAVACAFLAERVDRRFGSPMAVSLAVAVGAASVAWWWLGERAGQGDLRPYLFVQFAPMLVVALALLLHVDAVSTTTARVTDRAWWTVLGLYAVAKAFEGADAVVLHATGELVSGHTLKHLLAAAGALVPLRAAANGHHRGPKRAIRHPPP